jgi:hypothetical protein
VGSSSPPTSEARLLDENPETNKEVVTKQESSSNPTWGQSKGATKEQLEEDWQVWEHANIHETSIVYHHGRCHDCDKPVSSTNLDPGRMLICWKFKPNIIEDETQWGRIPIPTSDDSSDEYWFDESTGSDHDEGVGSTEPIFIAEESESNAKKNARNNYMSVVKKNYDNQVMGKEESINLAFLIGPRREGIILTKDGTLRRDL